MNLLRWYLRTLLTLLEWPDSLDPTDLVNWLIRRWVAGLMVLPIVAPVAIGGTFAYDYAQDAARTAALAASPCVQLVPPRFVTGEPNGTATDGRCDAWYPDRLHVSWVKRGPFIGTGETTLYRWEWDRAATVREVADGGGNRYLVLEPVDGGRVEVRGSPKDERALLAGIADRANR